jgi:hypothetical protein
MLANPASSCFVRHTINNLRLVHVAGAPTTRALVTALPHLSYSPRQTRRKFLVGAVVLARVEKSLLEESVLRGWMDGALERAEDRRLFGLSTK